MVAQRDVRQEEEEWECADGGGAVPRCDGGGEHLHPGLPRARTRRIVPIWQNCLGEDYLGIGEDSMICIFCIFDTAYLD